MTGEEAIDDDPSAPRSPSAVLILGVHGRSGTNHLHDLLRLHPDLEPVRGLWEDYLVAHLDDLDRYRRSLQGRWANQQIGSGPADDLAASIGDGIVEFLRRHIRAPGIPVLKSPTPMGLELVPRFLPTVRVIVLVRDARDVAESCVRTFGSTRQRWLTEWRDGARTILAGLRIPEVAERVRLVRYEDVVADRHRVVSELVEFLGLPHLEVGPQELDAVPLRGSSELADQGGVHWKAVGAPEGFDPLRRASTWSPAELRVADLVVGAELDAFGYPRSSSPGRLDPLLWGAVSGWGLGSRGVESIRFRLGTRLRRRRHRAGGP